MRAARLTESLTVAEVDTPAPGVGELLIEVHAVGVNQLERQVMAGARLGAPALLPRTIGIDPAGVVVGQGTGDDRIGQRVAVKPNVPCSACRHCAAGQEADCVRQSVVGVHRDGGAADYVVVPDSVAFELPDGLPFDVAAAAVHSVPIALHMIRRGGGVQPGDTVLVTGATGALGCAAVQVAAALGGRVIAGALTGEPIDELPALGAGEVITYERDTTPELPEANLAIDATGSGTLISAAARGLAWAGHVVFAAALPNTTVEIDPRPFYARRLTLHGCAAADYADVRDALAMIATGLVRPPVAATFGLPEIEDAYAMAARRDHLGKVVVKIRD